TAVVQILQAQSTSRPASGGTNAQVVDTTFKPRLNTRTYRPGAGPVVTVDEAHHNFHTVGGRYRPFANLLAADGFTLRSGRAPLSATSLQGTSVLVIANALSAHNEATSDWRLPAYSAFDSTEIAALAEWVRQGGALLLIADHMPFAGAAAPLASAFGIQFANGYPLLR